MIPTIHGVDEIPETQCNVKVAADGVTMQPNGKPCKQKTRQAFLLGNLPHMGKRKVHFPACEDHIKVIMGEVRGGIQFTEGPLPVTARREELVQEVCPDCGNHPVTQACRLGPRRLP